MAGLGHATRDRPRRALVNRADEASGHIHCAGCNVHDGGAGKPFVIVGARGLWCLRACLWEHSRDRVSCMRHTRQTDRLHGTTVVSISDDPSFDPSTIKPCWTFHI